MSILLVAIVVVAIIGLLGVAAIVAAIVGRGGVFKAAMTVLGLVLLTAVTYVLLASFAPEFIDARFRTYKAFYRDIEPGMTRGEVMTLVDRHYPATGARQRPKMVYDDADRLGFFMNPETSHEPNCEGIFLSMSRERVTAKSYSAD